MDRFHYQQSGVSKAKEFLFYAIAVAIVIPALKYFFDIDLGVFYIAVPLLLCVSGYNYFLLGKNSVTITLDKDRFIHRDFKNRVLERSISDISILEIFTERNEGESNTEYYFKFRDRSFFCVPLRNMHKTQFEKVADSLGIYINNNPRSVSSYRSDLLSRNFVELVPEPVN